MHRHGNEMRCSSNVCVRERNRESERGSVYAEMMSSFNVRLLNYAITFTRGIKTSSEASVHPAAKLHTSFRFATSISRLWIQIKILSISFNAIVSASICVRLLAHSRSITQSQRICILLSYLLVANAVAARANWFVCVTVMHVTYIVSVYIVYLIKIDISYFYGNLFLQSNSRENKSEHCNFE